MINNKKHKLMVEKNNKYKYLYTYEKGDITNDNKYVINKKTYIRVQCNYCGKEQDKLISNRNRKCLYCCDEYENSFAYYIQQELKEPLNKYWDWEKNTVNPYCIAKNKNIKIWIKCDKKDYHESYIILCTNFIRGDRCPYCSTRHGKVHPLDSFAKVCIDTVDKNFVEKYWSNKNTVNPWEITPYNNNKVWIKCQRNKKHEDYEVGCASFIRNNSRCPYCSHRKIHPLDSFGTLYPEKAKYWSENNKTSPYEVAPKSNRKFKFRCEECDKEFERAIYNLTRTDIGVLCKDCSISKGERKIIEYLKNNYNKMFIHDEPYFEDLIGINGGILRPDFLLIEDKIWIEYDGSQHDEWKDKWMSYEEFTTLQEHDKRKDKYAKQYGWKMIRIKEKDYNNIEKILKQEL